LGLLPDADVATLKKFGNELDHRFGDPIKETSGKTRLRITPNTPISTIIIQEDIRQGERIRKYRIEGKKENNWITLATGSCVGHKRIETFEPVIVKELRLVIEESTKKPKLKYFAAF